jgi:hypothetical protein
MAEIWRRRRGRFVSYGDGLRKRNTLSNVPESKRDSSDDRGRRTKAKRDCFSDNQIRNYYEKCSPRHPPH